jgi:hypothetical protein
MANTGRMTRMALSTPVIKVAALATGTSRAAQRLKRDQKRVERQSRRSSSSQVVVRKSR